MNSNTHLSSPYKRTTIFLFTVLTVLFAGLYLFNEQAYRQITSEDNLVEWLTFAGLFFAALVSFFIAWRIKKRYHYYHWFFILFFAFNLLAGFEEISWGQRVFDIRSGEFFMQYNDQQETNLHNTFQGIVHIKTKHIALLVLFVYGVILPWLMQKNKLPNLQEKYQFILPPGFLKFPFVAGTILMFDFQTGYEEEIGEFYFSLCFLFMMLWNRRLLKQTSIFAPKCVIVAFQPEVLLSANNKKVS